MFADNGIIDHQAGTITYTALPCPLPEAWQLQLKLARLELPSERAFAIEAVERRARATIGFEVTRPYIKSVAGLSDE